jgi:indole-3-glycerol phosphate synthase
VVVARALGASAVLLIARAVPAAELRRLARAAADEGLQSLIEVRSEHELESALEAGASVIGVNNRDLETLAIDPATSERLVPLIPADRPAIYESGVAGRPDVERAASCGADAVLVGSTLSAASGAEAAVRALTGVPRLGRGA